MKKLFKFKIGCIVLVILTITGCKKWVDVPSPVTSINAENVYNSDATAAAVMTGVYTNMSSASLSGAGSLSSVMSLYPGLAADELTLFPGILGNYAPFYANLLTNLSSPNPWAEAYSKIHVFNAVLEGVGNSKALTPAVAKQLLGEAKFMRAFYFSYLVGLYGDVPLVLTTDYKVSRTMPRTAKELVYQQVIKDLLEAQSLLSQNFLDASLTKNYNERVRPTSWAATALLARVYLYTKEYGKAEVEASKVLANTSSFGLSTLNGAFLKSSVNNKEAIWQLQPVNLGWNTEDARLFIVPSTGFSSSYPVHLSESLLSSFEAGDNRRSNWVGSVTLNSTTYWYPYKYKVATLNASVNEFQMILRLAELYLIRAEARANGAGTGFTGGKQDLDVIRQRAGLPGTTASTPAELLTAIKKEKRIEFFAEWGHRWFDLKRWGDIDAVMTAIAPAKNSTWNASYQYWPIPATELNYNPNLVQNKDY